MKSLSYYLIKIDRIAAWILFFLMFTNFVTGYGLTKGIIDPQIALKLHLGVLPLVILFFFLVHTILAIRIALIRHRAWNRVSKTILIFLYLLFFGGFIYIGLIYKKPVKIESPEASNLANQNNISVATPTPAKKIALTNPSQGSNFSERTFTITELKQYNGQNGKPAYSAVSGVVYDLSNVFRNGSHFSHLAGRDLTQEFNGQHYRQQITKYPRVGVLK